MKKRHPFYFSDNSVSIHFEFK